MPLLFEPVTLRGLTVPNRAWMAPMGNWATAAHPAPAGHASDFHLAHYGARAAAGLGLVIVEATSVSADGRNTASDMGLWADHQIAPLARVATAIRDGGAVPAIQLAHHGRKGSVTRPWEGTAPVAPADGGWERVGPTALAAPGLPVPRELTTGELAGIVEDFRTAAVRARAAGFDAVEIHAAHGFLLHSFLSPVSNRRTDAYGGSRENRMRLTLEVIDAIREVWPGELPLLMRISVTDWLESDPATAASWTPEDSAALSQAAYRHGVDLVDVSSGGIAPVAVPAHRTYQTELAAALRRRTDAAIGAVGRIHLPEQAEEILQAGDADVVLIGRSLLRNASWANEAAVALGAEPRYPRHYAHYLDKQPLSSLL